MFVHSYVRSKCHNATFVSGWRVRLLLEGVVVCVSYFLDISGGVSSALRASGDFVTILNDQFLLQQSHRIDHSHNASYMFFFT